MRISLIPASLMLVFSGIVILVIIDTSIIDISSYVEGYTLELGVILFPIMVTLSAIFQYALLRRLWDRALSFCFKKYYTFFPVNFAIPMSIVFFLAVVFIEVYISSSYHSILVKIIIWSSYGLAIFNMSVLLYYFVQWIRYNRNYLVISYFFAIIALSLNLIVALVAITKEQSNEQELIMSFRVPVESSSSSFHIYNSLYDYTSIISFILLWFSSILLLFHYTKKIGRPIFGFLAILPLIYFLSRFSSIFSGYFLDLSFDYPSQAMIIYTVILASGKPVGGLLFGFVFWRASKNIGNKFLKEYLSLAGCGIMLLFTSNQVMSLTYLDYPPFGIITVSFLGLASYLMFIGIYTSSICIAQDRELRSTLKKSTERQQNLMDHIGTAQMERSLVKNAESVMKKMTNRTGVEYVEEENYKVYLQEVIKEVIEKNTRNRKPST